MTSPRQLSPVLREFDDGDGGSILAFRCPGCCEAHHVSVGVGPGPRWGYDGNAEKPTFSPSVLVTREAHPDAPDDFAEYRTALRCHSFVRNGQIQFLSDCTHKLAGQTVDLPPWEDA